MASLVVSIPNLLYLAVSHFLTSRNHFTPIKITKSPFIFRKKSIILPIQEKESIIESSSLRVLFAFQCSVLALMPNAFAEDAPVTPPKHYLYQDMPHNSAADCGMVNGLVTFNGWIGDVAEVRSFFSSPYYSAQYNMSVRYESAKR